MKLVEAHCECLHALCHCCMDTHAPSAAFMTDVPFDI